MVKLRWGWGWGCGVVWCELLVMSCHDAICFFEVLVCRAAGLTPLEPQSRFGDKPLKYQVVCPQNGTAVLKGLRLSNCLPKRSLVDSGWWWWWVGGGGDFVVVVCGGGVAVPVLAL